MLFIGWTLSTNRLMPSNQSTSKAANKNCPKSDLVSLIYFIQGLYSVYDQICFFLFIWSIWTQCSILAEYLGVNDAY